MKKVVVIGCGMDVTTKKRGSFITDNFDEVIVMKRSIFHLESHSEYIGTPTIWVNGGREWRKYDWITSKIEEKLKWREIYDKNINFNLQQKIYNILDKSNIREVWLNYLERDDHYSFTPHNNIPIKNISMNLRDRSDSTYFCSTGMQTIIYAINSGYDVYYFGVDSFRKGHHYYPECTSVFMDPETLNTDDIYDYNHKCSNYLKENREIKKLIDQGRLKHIDTVC